MEAHIVTGDASIQGSESWKNYRDDKIGGSDSAIVMGLSPYKTPLQLYNEKKGITPPEEQNWAMQQGIDLEPIAREAYEEETGLIMIPEVLNHKELDYMIASLDGRTMDKTAIVEIKCGKAAYKQAKDGVIPDYYMAQLQHNMYVAGLDRIHYFCLDPDSQYLNNQIEAIFGEGNIKPKYETILMTVERNEDFVELMLEAEAKFAECLRTDTPPPPSERDVVNIEEELSDPHKCAVMDKLLEMMPEYRAIEKTIKELKKEAIKIANDRSVTYHGLEIKKSIRKGTINYAKLLEDIAPEVDVEDYRKKSTEAWTINVK